jgi:hypothetical protein
LRANSRQLISASVTLALIASAATFAQSKAGQKVLKHIGVAGEPSKYTELAFVDPTKLPNAVYQPRSQLLVPFTITNHEHVATTYHWQIVAAARGSRVVRAGEVSLSAGAYAYFDPVLELGCATRTQVTVRLTTGEHIDFWAACIHSPSRIHAATHR